MFNCLPLIKLQPLSRMKATNLPLVRVVIPGKDVRKTHRSGDQSLETGRAGAVLSLAQNEIPSCAEQNLFVTSVLSSHVSALTGRVSDRVASFDVRTPEGSLPIVAHSVGSSSLLLPLLQNIQFDIVALLLRAEFPFKPDAIMSLDTAGV